MNIERQKFELGQLVWRAHTSGVCPCRIRQYTRQLRDDGSVTDLYTVEPLLPDMKSMEGVSEHSLGITPNDALVHAYGSKYRVHAHETAPSLEPVEEVEAVEIIPQLLPVRAVATKT